MEVKMVLSGLVSSRLLVCSAVFLLHVATTKSSQGYPSQTELDRVTVTIASVQCRSCPCGYYCYWWRCRRVCRYRGTCTYCNTYYIQVTVTRTKCKDKWTGPNCDIPICPKACTNGESCGPTDLTYTTNECKCKTSSGSKCTAEGCPGRSCYPGTCFPSGSTTCQCPPEFSGENCLTIKQTPEVSDCSVKLFFGSPEVEVAKADCAVEGFSPGVVWVNRKSFSRIESSWEVTYRNPYRPVLPTDTNHIRDAKFGVAKSTTIAHVTTSSSDKPREQRVGCRNQIDETFDPPQEHEKCRTRSINWNEFGIGNLQDNSTIYVNVTAQLGGYKLLTSNIRELFLGSSETVRTVLFKVDVEPPSHCRRIQSQRCMDPAIYLAQDAVQNGVVDVNISNWYDDGSGLEKYNVKIFQLAFQSGSNMLVTPQNAQKDFELFHKDRTDFQHTFTDPGVYSIEVTVTDHAKNSYKARKIVFFDNENKLETSSEPFKVTEASKDSGYRWITEMPRDEIDGKSRLHLDWKGRYINNRHLSNGWLSRVEGMPPDWGIDDNLRDGDGGTVGNRTIHAIENSNGTVGVRLGFKVDKHQGGWQLSKNDIVDYNGTAPTELEEKFWITKMGAEARTATQTLVMPKLSSNDTVVIWIEVYDVAGHSREERIQIGFDTSPPELDSAEPVKWDENSPDQYHTRIHIQATDMESGIREVEYIIYDKSLNINITADSAKSTGLQNPSGKGARTGLPVCSKTSTSCYCTMGGECFEKSVRIEIDHCTIDKYYSEEKIMELKYWVVNNAGQKVSPREPYVMKFKNGPPLCRSVTAFTTGVLLLIIIAIIILLVLIVLVILMLVRWKQHKHPIPDRVRTMASSMRQRITNTEKVHSADGRVIYRTKTKRGRYTDDEYDDIYVDGSDPGGWRVNLNQVELYETLAEGRFAVIKKAYLKKGGETKPVAAKFLRAGSSDADKTLLKAKIAFHGNRVPPHENIVRLMGVVDEGPIMLLELCDMTLKEWLSNITKVTEDVLENMLNFIIHIASGMEFLHSKSIVHRRLAVRNVLLKKEGANGLVAKLIGFGTFTDSTVDGESASEELVVPLKWLAPETLASAGKGKADYTQKSDVWSFGVTVWEIYSLGATPYSGKKSSEVEALLKTGYRMPCPENCPPELFDVAVKPCWNLNSKKRPDFKTLLRLIRNFRSGGDVQDGYYAPGASIQGYANPKERTSEYTTRGKGNEYQGDSQLYDSQLYDDSRK